MGVVMARLSLAPGRKHISGMLVGGFGTHPDVRVLGLIHSGALHPSWPELISETPFSSRL